jgi:hypothetical protein
MKQKIIKAVFGYGRPSLCDGLNIECLDVSLRRKQLSLFAIGEDLR